ncbi:zinc-binding alcohol dehydrogenase family protein [Sporosarcina sp. OR05]|uniref:quinone oxidoreductase family protein n=1 Tax=Sporosarcina sp. OR05 TaxID=2969819 RepID=UPI00352A4574
MKAVIQHEYGDASVLSYTEMDRPKIRENEVVIKVKYAGVNYADIKKRTGNKEPANFPLVLGLDAAGVIEEVFGESKFSKGDRVIAFPKNGAYAEYVVAKEDLVFKIPESLSLERAATMPTVSILSYLLIHEIGQVQPTDTIVIHSAAGGVGTMLVQLAKLAGVKNIICTVGSLTKERYVRGLGADIVCTYDDFVDVVLTQTNGKGANVILDSVAGEITRKSMECLALYGTLVQFGNSSGSIGTFTTADVHSSCRNVKGFSLGTTRKHNPKKLAPIAQVVLELFASNKITLPIACTFSLHEAAEAHRLVESRNYEGKILLKM